MRRVRSELTASALGLVEPRDATVPCKGAEACPAPRGRRLLWRDGSGQALVEFALIAMFLFAIVFGTIEAGRLLYTYSTLSSAAREGARFGIVHPTNTTGIRNAAITRAAALNLAAANVAVTCNPCTVGDTLSVAVTDTFRSVALFVLPDVRLRASATMFVE